MQQVNLFSTMGVFLWNISSTHLQMAAGVGFAKDSIITINNGRSYFLIIGPEKAGLPSPAKPLSAWTNIWNPLEKVGYGKTGSLCLGSQPWNNMSLSVFR